MGEPVSDRPIDGLEDQFFDLGGDPRRNRADQSQPAFPRTTASSIACAVIADVNWPISVRAGSNSQFRSDCWRPGLRAANAANAASFAVRRIPITVDTSTCHLRATSDWVISPDVTFKNTSHFVSGDNNAVADDHPLHWTRNEQLAVNSAGLLDFGPDALVSGRAAAALLGLDGFDESGLAFLVPRNQRDRHTVGLVTSTHDISRLDRVNVDGLACTSCTRAIVQLLGRASEREVGNALDSGTRMRLTAPSVVRRRLDELGTKGRVGLAVFNRVMESAGVQSWLERRFLALMRSSGLPKRALQRTYRSDGNHVARVDFDFGPKPVIVEVGGQKGYLSFDERRRQEHRRNELQLWGKTIYSSAQRMSSRTPRTSSRPSAAAWPRDSESIADAVTRRDEPQSTTSRAQQRRIRDGRPRQIADTAPERCQMLAPTAHS